MTEYRSLIATATATTIVAVGLSRTRSTALRLARVDVSSVWSACRVVAV
ncbi:hypothetical protein [Actinokineospora sp.]